MHGDQGSGADEPASANIRAVAYARLERLNPDLRALSPIGIERAAWGWDRHENTRLEALHAAERAALHAIESSGETEAWDEWRRRLFQEVEGRLAFVAWRAEHRTHAGYLHKKERGGFPGGPRGVSPA